MLTKNVNINYEKKIVSNLQTFPPTIITKHNLLLPIFQGEGDRERSNTVRVQRPVRAVGSWEQLRWPTGHRHHGSKLGQVYTTSPLLNSSLSLLTHFSPFSRTQGAGDAVRARS